MRIVGMLRVKNESRWIERVIDSILPLCDSVVVLDDKSDDNTAHICASMPRTDVFASPFADMREDRDKNYLLGKVMIRRPDWILAIDGDELLCSESIPLIRESLNTTARCMSFKIRYLWDNEHQVRTDRVYGLYARQSMFRPGPERFSGNAAGFHCGNVPMSLWGSCCYPGATLLHLGYMDRVDRIRKYRWYNETDPNNVHEDRYRHIVQGDIPEVPAHAVLRHAGPLQLRPLSEVL